MQQQHQCPTEQYLIFFDVRNSVLHVLCSNSPISSAFVIKDLLKFKVHKCTKLIKKIKLLLVDNPMSKVTLHQQPYQ